MNQQKPELAVFDLDHTLLNGDSDYLWGQFLVRSGLIDAEGYEKTNRDFYRQYLDGTLDIVEFARFSMAPLARLAPQVLQNLRSRFIRECIVPAIAAGTPDLLETHRRVGRTLVITTATNRFITAPIAELLGVAHLLATEPETVDGRYTGRLTGIPNFRAGKVTRLQQWMSHQDRAFGSIHAYSDSHNDLPLLELADRPTAVDPDPQLKVEAERRGWPVISLRG